MKLVSKKDILAFRQDPDSLSTFHEFTLPTNSVVGFISSFEDHGRYLQNGKGLIPIFRTFWYKNGNTIVIFVKLSSISTDNWRSLCEE